MQLKKILAMGLIVTMISSLSVGCTNKGNTDNVSEDG